MFNLSGGFISKVLIFFHLFNIIIVMKIVIVGYGEMFRALITGVLKTKHEIVGVFRHDNVLYPKYNRFLVDKLMPSEDYNFVKNLNLYDIIAPSVNSKQFKEELEKLETDLIIVGSWSERFEMQTINTPKVASINVHPSLLPKYRGPNPYIHVILNNEKQTGITFHLMDVNYDTGAILHQKEVNILPDDTGKSLKTRCCDTARQEIAVLLNNIETFLKNPKSQNEKAADYQSQIALSSCILDFEKESSEEITKRIRALTPWLDCVIPYKNNFFSFEKYNVCSKPCDKEPAQIVKITPKALFIVCKDHKVIEFSHLKIKSPFSSFLTELYLKKIIKINTKAI